MQNHEMSRIPLVTHRPFAKFATEPNYLHHLGCDRFII